MRTALALEQRRRVEALEADVVQKLQRAFRDLPREAPEYDLFAVRAERGGAERQRGEAAAEGVVAPPGRCDDAVAVVIDEALELLPPGPLAQVEVSPARPRVERFGRRGLRARASDAAGVRITTGVRYEWTIVDGDGTLEPHDATAVFVAGGELGRSRVAVTARAGASDARVEVEVAIVEALPETAGPRPGIPEPAFVDDPAGEWRSRLDGGRWEVNSGHRDFAAATGSAKRKLRYLAALLAKEVVLHSFPVPQGGPLLERLVSVLAMAEPRIERG